MPGETIFTLPCLELDAVGGDDLARSCPVLALSVPDKGAAPSVSHQAPEEKTRTGIGTWANRLKEFKTLT